MRTWSSIAFIIGCILFIFGISIYTSSDYGLPPVPAGWVVAICFLILSGALIFSGITMFHSFIKTGRVFRFNGNYLYLRFYIFKI